jgi:hypothetical protein
MSNSASDIKIEIRNLTVAYGGYVVLRDITTRIRRGQVFIMGDWQRQDTSQNDDRPESSTQGGVLPTMKLLVCE